MIANQNPVKAAEIHSAKAKEARNAQVFSLTWRGGGYSELVGWTTVCAWLGCKESTLRVRLSESRNAYQVLRANPDSGVEDIVTVARLVLNKPKAKRGRPPKTLDKARLGVEFE